MAEADTSQLQEAMAESQVGKAVRGAVEKAKSKYEQTHAEYARINKAIKEGPKVKDMARNYVRNMDKILEVHYSNMGFPGKIMEKVEKLAVRAETALVSSAVIGGDMWRNIFTWPIRKLTGYPEKNFFRKTANTYFETRKATRGAGAVMAKAETTGVKGVIAGAKFLHEAPKVAIYAAKEKIDQTVNWIKNPFRVEAKGPMKLKH